MVGTGRFELPTCRLGGDRSIHLSYVPGSKASLILNHFDIPARCQKPLFSPKLYHSRIETPFWASAAERLPNSYARWFSCCSASRFIWSLIWECFLNTAESSCRGNCVTHASATPPALNRVA